MKFDLPTKSTITALLKILPALLFTAMIGIGGCASMGNSSSNHNIMAADTSDVDSTKDGVPKPYDEVITDEAVTQSGLFTVHHVDDRWFFEIPDSLLGGDMLVVNRLAKAPVDNHPEDRRKPIQSMMGYAGDLINKTMIRLERGPGYKVFFRAISYNVNPDSTSPMYRSVSKSNVQPIINVLDIKAIGKDSTTLVVDITDLVLKDERLFSFDPQLRLNMELQKFDEERSYIVNIKTFPTNTEIKTVRTYIRQPMDENQIGVPKLEPSSKGYPESSLNSTMEVNSSINMLPKVPLEPRYYDDRVGYFATGYTDFDTDPQGAKSTYMVTRWNLEPKEKDIAKYKRGELVEPKKPIVYYIDPATPDKWIPYLIQGVNDWQKAFEQAGFKNAIRAERAPAPAEDSTWSLEDARYSAIVYKASRISNASGPNINDPRSGQILESHINWYHNVMKLARNWYLVQASPSDSAARHAVFNDELMGQLIRFIVSHEVGHALGLRHNMGASFATPVEKLRDREWLKENGHTASIMDYARFNYVAQPEDSVGRAGIFPRINDYDLWAIKWGYRYLPGKTKEEKKEFLAELTTQETANPRLRFISGEERRADPRAQTEDLGDNAMAASAYGIKNLKFIIPKLENWVTEEGEDYSTLTEVYNAVVNQYFQYMFHVIENIGGVYHTPKVAGQSGEVYKITPKPIQEGAMSFISEYILHEPEWLLNEKILDKIWSPENDITTILSKYTMDELYNNDRLSRLVSSKERAEGDSYTAKDYMQDIQDELWSELDTGAPIDNYRQTLQNFYIEKMADLSTPFKSAAENLLKDITTAPTADITKTVIPGISRFLLRSLENDISKALPKTEDQITRIHLENVRHIINSILKDEAS